MKKKDNGELTLLQKYRIRRALKDPVLFAEQILGVSLWEREVEIRFVEVGRCLNDLLLFVHFPSPFLRVSSCLPNRTLPAISRRFGKQRICHF
jgi:hypothetical protein